MISEKTYKKYKKLVNYEPTGILHLLSGTMIYTHLDNTGVGRKARRMMVLHQWLSMVGAFNNNKPSTKRIPLVFRTPNSAKAYMGMVLSNQDKLEHLYGYIFRVDDTTLASPTKEAIMRIGGQLLHNNNNNLRIKRHINEFEFIPMDYDSTMRLYTDHKLTKEEMLNEIRVYEEFMNSNKLN